MGKKRGKRGEEEKREESIERQDFFFSSSFFKKTRNVPVLYTAGNHEASTTPTLAEAAFPGIDDGGECAQAYDRLLLQPKPAGQQFYW